MAKFLFGAVPFFIALAVVSALFGITRSRNRVRAFKVAAMSLAAAGVAFVLSVIVGSAGAIPV
ncbi:hypothetical protein [Arthrobacter sp. UYEF3]|uniref:hypothetical protein n=1 Tax=Arthrobacter sp. UYEF3 TaxID=1756365 RepID=UPI0033922947